MLAFYLLHITHFPAGGGGYARLELGLQLGILPKKRIRR